MHDKKIIVRGLVFGIVLSSIPVKPIAINIAEHKIIKDERGVNRSKNKDYIKERRGENPIKVNKNIVEGSVLEIVIGDGEYVPDLTGNLDGYETVRVSTVGSKKLVTADYDNLRASGIPKIDLSRASSDYIPSGAFANATYLTSFKFPSGITRIGNLNEENIGAFYNCVNLTGSLVIPDTVSSIGFRAFYGCSSLDGQLKIPDSVINIGSSAFNGCSGLTGSLIIPNSVLNISSYAFYGCSGFTGDLILPSSINRVDTCAFYGCSGFNGKLVIPDSVTIIEDSSFNGCSGLVGDLVLPSKVVSVGFRAFYGCSSLNGQLIIPSSVVTIGSSAFNKCSGLTGGLYIPDSVTNIGSYAFYKCHGFNGNLIIPDSVKQIGEKAFDGLSKIDKILIKVNSSHLAIDYKKAIIDNLPNNHQTVIDIPYDFNTSGTWMETTSKRVGKPIIKNVVNGVESDLINNKGETISLYIPSLYQESNVVVLKDGKISPLPIKDSNDKHIFKESGIYQVTITTDLGNISTINFKVEDPQFKNAEDAVKKSEVSRNPIDIDDARNLVNKLPECLLKDQLHDRINTIVPDITMELKTSISNVDIYIKSENMLSLSLDTNLLTFNDFSGIEDVESLNAVNLTVSSSLPYKINTSLPVDIVNSDKSNSLDKNILNIRANGQDTYKTLDGLNNAVTLLDNEPNGNNKVHGIDVMLKGNIAHKKDVYKTTIKFEIEQK